MFSTHQRSAHSSAPPRLLGIGVLVRRKDALDVLGRDADAAVGDVDAQHRPRRLRRRRRQASGGLHLHCCAHVHGRAPGKFLRVGHCRRGDSGTQMQRVLRARALGKRPKRTQILNDLRQATQVSLRTK